MPPLLRAAEPAVHVGAWPVAWTKESMASPGQDEAVAVTPNLANLIAVPLTAHHTSVAPAPNRKFAAHCLCGWSGEIRTDAAAACRDANAHEDGAT